VHNLVLDLSEAVEERIKVAFDLSRIAKEVTAKGRFSFSCATELFENIRSDPVPSSQGLLYKSRLRTEPTNLTAPQWTAALWQRLELMVEEMAGCCIKASCHRAE
jgi:conserved oligomeric Golgi complex subunit 5